MIYWPAKAPEEVEDFYFDFSSVLQDGETIVSEVVTPNDNVTVDDEDIVGEKVQVWLSGGIAGSVGVLICTIVTSSDRTYSEVAVLEINGEAVSLAIAKASQKIDIDDEDILLGTFLRAAIGHVEARSGKLLTQKIVSQIVNRFPANKGPIRLDYGPVTEMLEVLYDDSSGTEQELVDFRLVGGKENLLLPDFSVDWPTAAVGQGAVRLSYIAGYGPTDRERSELIQAALLLFGHFNANREAVAAITGKSTNIELPLGVQALIAPHRNPGMA
jgi:uncharacterized phiE125 gp8 family phage protein